MIALDDGLINGNLNLADVAFFVAVVLFVLYAIVQFAREVDGRMHGLLLGLGLACVSFGLLVW